MKKLFLFAALWVNASCFANLDLEKDIGRQRMFFCAALLSGNGYARKTSPGTWHKTAGVATGISAYVTY